MNSLTSLVGKPITKHKLSKLPKIMQKKTWETITGNTSYNEGFCFLKLLEVKKNENLVKIWQKFKTKMAKNKKWHIKLTYIKALWKYLSLIASTASHFQALKSYEPKT